MSEPAASESDTIASAGTALRTERERQSLSINDVSRHLKLSERQIEALERDDFKQFGGPVFVHGFLRNYAKLLGIDAPGIIEKADQILAPSIAEEAEEAEPQPFPVHAPIRRMPVVVIGAIVLILGLAGFFITRQDHQQSGENDQESVLAENGTHVSQEPQSTAAMTEPGAEVEVNATPDNQSDQVQSLRDPERTRDPDLPVGVLQFVFVDESWVEVTDRYGDVIFSQLTPRGAVRIISGQPPLSVVIGNASGVELSYNQRAVDLAPHTRVDVARLNLE